MHGKKKQPDFCGFTIVELLVVIVVIGVLAAITIVSYTGINQKAKLASVQSDLENSQKQMMLFHVDNSTYPTTIDCDQLDSVTNKCLKPSQGNSYDYKTGLTEHGFYCLEVSNSDYVYHLTQENQRLSGPCPSIALDASSALSYVSPSTSWSDLSGNENNGTLFNGASYSSSGEGSISFDGIDDYVSVPNSSSLNSGSLTLSMWLYIRDNLDCDVNNNWRSLIRKSPTASGTSTGFDIVLEQDRRIAWDTGSGLSDRWWPTGLVIPMSTWSNLTVVYDSTGYKYAYLDGNLIGTKAITAAPISNNSDNLRMSNSNAVCPNGDGNFPGLIKSVSLYNKALLATEIKAIYDATK